MLSIERYERITAITPESWQEGLQEYFTDTKSYGANQFEQTSLAAFLGNFAPQPGGVLYLSVDSGGPVMYYISTIDNRTNDSSIKMIVAK